MRPKMLLYRLAVLAAAWTSPAAAAGDTDGGAARQITIRTAELREDSMIRVFASVVETQDGVAYPISTLDRNAFTLFIGSTAATPPQTAPGSDTPVRLTSLGSFSSYSPRRRRGLVVAFDRAGSGRAREAGALPSSIAEILPQIFGDFLAIYGIDREAARKIAETTPAHSENVKILQRLISEQEHTQDPPTPDDLEHGLCAAAAKFTEWQPELAGPGDQRALILTVAGDQSSTDEHACWERLATAKVAVYVVAIGRRSRREHAALAELVQATGGFVQDIESPLDAFRALSNIAANLNDEYVLEAHLEKPLAALGAQAALSVQASYHGNLIRSQATVITVPSAAAAEPALLPPPIREPLPDPADTAPAVAPAAAPAPTAGFDLIAVFCATIMLLSIVGGGWLWLKRRGRQPGQICTTCKVRVGQERLECPLQSPACIGRLVLLEAAAAGGPLAIKQVFPLTEGEFFLGTARQCKIRLPYSGVRRQHAKITLKSRRALFESSSNSTDTIDGWQVHEPRLLAHGSLLRIGTAYLRFEAKKPL